MDFGIEKCVMLIMKSDKKQITERIRLPNQERIEILEADTINQARMKEQNKKRVPQTKEKTRNQALQQTFHLRNKHFICTRDHS